jgi:dihydroorotase
MADILIKNATIINRGLQFSGDVLIRKGRIERIDSRIDKLAGREIDATGLLLIPGMIDDQVHFREPGLIHKATINSESRAAIAGGVTSFMEMPNTKPPAVTQQLLSDKYDIGRRDSLANYSFYMGASNDNLEEVLKTDPSSVCGIKAFMGSSTGNMLVDDPVTLDRLFQESPMLIATHCEDETTIRRNLGLAREIHGNDIPIADHPKIRSREACYLSSQLAIKLAKKHQSRLHILHISTEEELSLFSNDLPLSEKRITAEACVHHLSFTDEDYPLLGSKIKCNPAIKSSADRKAIIRAVIEDFIDVIATDHAPHTKDEKEGNYMQAPSGLPLVQHAIPLLLMRYHKDELTLEQIVEKACHAPAVCFKIEDRGFVDEGYWADLALVDLNEEWTVDPSNILYKCGWSPLERVTMRGRVKMTFVNGQIVFDNGKLDESHRGMRLKFYNQ